MTDRPTIAFSKIAAPKTGSVVVLSAEGKGSSPVAKEFDPGGILERAAGIAEFTGKFGSALDVIAPAGVDYDRLVAIGAGKPADLDEKAWQKLGGTIFARSKKAANVAVLAHLAEMEVGARDVADLAMGIVLRAYAFDKYKTKKNDKGKKAGRKADKPARFTIQCADPNAARKAFARAEAIADGVVLARDLVNEPANILGPVEFAAKAAELEKLGVEIDILTEKEMKKLGMGAYLGVSQGSARPPRLVVMQWKGGKAKDKPVAFIGKGVVFDTGGISIKPSAGMEDMKGDMGGAAAVTGLMHALAARKAKANVVGVLGLVENMPDAEAQRPGDIVTSMSGQTIEIINTDAEGRLILADVLWYCNERFEPRFMIDLATLTGAILVALGNQHAGLFSNDDTLAGQLSAAGEATGEKVWRMPLAAEYDKQIDSKNADMKNTGGRHAGSITAAQFLKRYVKDTPWAHLDIAGTAMSSPSTEINQSWASGYGVRLLDRLVADHYEG